MSMQKEKEERGGRSRGGGEGGGGKKEYCFLEIHPLECIAISLRPFLSTQEHQYISLLYP